jgi:cobalt-zinc-cadmium efflux system outer membrane protein
MKFISGGVVASLTIALTSLPAAAQSCKGQGLGLEAAIERALAADLRPDVARAAVTAARSERAVSALRPLDTVEVMSENFPGLGTGADINNLTVTGQFKRVWERGGKLDARLGVADAAVEVASAGIAIAEADIAYEIEALFVSLWDVRARLALAQERLEAAQSVDALVSRRVEAARDPLLAGSRAATDVAIAQGDIAALQDEAAALASAIFAFWGGEDLPIDTCRLAVMVGQDQRW